VLFGPSRAAWFEFEPYCPKRNQVKQKPNATTQCIRRGKSREDIQNMLSNKAKQKWGNDDDYRTRGWKKAQKRKKNAGLFAMSGGEKLKNRV